MESHVLRFTFGLHVENFPRRSLSALALGWVESEVNEWIAYRIAERREEQPGKARGCKAGSSFSWCREGGSNPHDLAIGGF